MTTQINDQSSSVILPLVQLQSKFKHLKLLQYLMTYLIVLISVVLVLHWLGLALLPLSIFTLIVLMLACAFYVKSTEFKQITVENLLLHLNREFPLLEESAQLTLFSSEHLSLLQCLQKNKITSKLQILLTQPATLLLPRVSFDKHLKAAVIAVILLSSLFQVTPEEVMTWLTGHIISKHQDTDVPLMTDMSENAIVITDAKVVILPPPYTKLVQQESAQLDIELLAGSLVTWTFNFYDLNKKYYIQWSSGEVSPLVKQANGTFTLEKIIEYSGIYRIGFQDGAMNGLLNDVYTLSVTQDKKPDIRILSPQANITELTKNGSTEVTTEVQITDDFGLSTIELVASIGKGSGEAIKFRDQKFDFDQIKELNGKSVYIKHWRLENLGMEPGDELYFTVNAWDNKIPKAQLTRSSTKIIRWLDDEQLGITSGGILIDFMPEYFKSQRQIIIETQELIIDQGSLSQSQFVETSELLGVAQSALKQKYGQYLGDEFEQVDGHHPVQVNDTDEHKKNDNIKSDQPGVEHSKDPIAGFEDEHQSHELELSTDKSGLSQSIAEFGHMHEDIDVGIYSREDPKAMMKQAIASMWQAELHLMLAEPNKALPFEQTALKLMNMAKKAERIYVKRLGFEPPPVSEKRRYQGELQDIVSYDRKEKITLVINNSDEIAKLLNSLAKAESYQNNLEIYKNELIKSTKILAQKNVNGQINKIVPSSILPIEITQINTVKTILSELVEERPALIKYVALLEEMSLNKSFTPINCHQCLADFKIILWQLIAGNKASPIKNKPAYSNDNELFKQYATFLENKASMVHHKVEQTVEQSR